MDWICRVAESGDTISEWLPDIRHPILTTERAIEGVGENQNG